MPDGRAGAETSLEGTSVVVTGGARGLGRAMSLALARAGASVLVVDVDDEPIDELLREAPGELHGLRGDVSLEADVDAVVAQANRLFGRLDVVVNNAGINLRTIGASDSPPEAALFYELGPFTVRRFFEVHVLAPFLLARAAVGPMLEQGFGRIVTITTTFATMTKGRSTPYGPMKAASEAFTASMAHDLEGTPVTANVLIPGGASATRLMGELPPEEMAKLINPAVMGPPSVWLASRESDGVNAMRFVANRWDPALPAEEAAAIAGAPIAWPAV
jgi:NAD(P)-dependent dehydrogenase (short-subunit alcohol dehydrogenase family)